MKRVNDFGPYTGILPYASEIFGVYQPLLGWRSKRVRRRIDRGFRNDTARLFDGLREKFSGQVKLALDERGGLSVGALKPAVLSTYQQRSAGSFVIDRIGESLPNLDNYDDNVWDSAIDAGKIQQALDTIAIPEAMKWYKSAPKPGGTPLAGRASAAVTVDPNQAVADQLDHEAAVAGYLTYLKDNKQYDKLKEIFYKPDNHLATLIKLIKFRDPLDYMDPFKDIDRAGLSPIGIVHLFRQYFFEFDTFLGTPVSHVWMSPGATVELVEISNRKTTVERTFEATSETIVKTEKQLTEEEEISDAVKEENKSDIKFGVNASATQGWIGGSATASSSLDIGTTQSKARETTHKRMRQQTEKLSTEIRKNFKSTFKTVTEVTDTSSKRYILSNTTDKLINYEMRRKMRQVGVQVQDIGTYLCWQTYVDDPGRQLGIAKLVHMAKGPEVADVPPPDKIAKPTDIVTTHNVEIPFVPKTEDTLPEDDMDEAYRNGKEVNLDDNEGSPERIQWKFDGQTAECDQANYHFAGTIDFDYGGADADIEVPEDSITEDPVGKIMYNIRLKHVNFHDVSPLRVVAKVTWTPNEDVIAEINAKDKEAIDKYNEKSKYEYEKAFVEAARERIKLASKIEARKFEDLREEERIVVYRSLIQEMLTKDIPMPDDRTRHVVSELLNTIFDIDKMLYFVAPEWWRPRLHRSHQSLGGLRKPSAVSGASGSSDASVSTGMLPAASASIYGQLKASAATKLIGTMKAVEDNQIASTDTVTWGGTNRPDNYYITDESDPAKLGSSLGWLLQLDGDNLRNAFLNAPWVKAVIPIRPGRERAAINWLQRLHVEGTEGLDDQYLAAPGELAEIPHSGPSVTVRDAINHLCDVVAEKHKESLEVDRYPTDEINDDNKVSATPVDKVYEHGFYPLQGGFRVMTGEEDFEVFDQWVEVLPTDQVVPVEVKYDPITGRQI